MGKTYGALHIVKLWIKRLLIFGLAGFGPLLTYGQFTTDLRNMNASNIRMPLYNGDEVRFLITANSIIPVETELKASDAMIDILRKNVDVDTIKFRTDDIYVIDAGILKIVNFWITRTGSEGVISTPLAMINVNQQTASGSDIVQVRTPLMDIDGVGFIANYGTQEVWIKQNVHIRLRLSGSALDEVIEGNTTPVNTLEDAEKLAKFADVWSDTMYINFETKDVLLEGNVRMDDGANEITCRRTALKLGGDKKSDSSGSLDSGISGVSLVEFFDDVVMKRKGSAADAQQTVNCAYASYDVEKDLITLTGSPSIMADGTTLSGKTITFDQVTQLLTVTGDCRLETVLEGEGSGTATVESEKMVMNMESNQAEATGNVRVKDGRGVLLSQRLVIDFESTGSADSGLDSSESIGLVGADALNFSSGSKEVKYIRCLDGVTFQGNNGENGQAREVDYDYRSGLITLLGDNPWIRQGGNRLSGDKIELAQATNHLKVYGNAKVVMERQERGGVGGLVNSVATSDFMDFDYPNNFGLLEGNVRINDALASAECDKMEIYLADAHPGETAKKEAEISGQKLDMDKTLNKVIGIGNVKASDPKGKLNCDRLVLHFMEGKAGTEISRVEPSGNVVVKTKGSVMADALDRGAEVKDQSKETVLKADQGYIDLVDNFAEFTGNVQVIDEQMQISSNRFNAYMTNYDPAAPVTTAPPESPELAFEHAVESEIPEQISIGDAKSLDRIVFLENVLITGKDESGTEFSARGEDGTYYVTKRLLQMTTRDGIKPLLSQGGTVTENEYVEVDVSKDLPIPRGTNSKIISFSPDWQ